MTLALDTLPTQAWHANPALGFAPMDEIHEEFIALLQRLLDAPDDAQVVLMDELIVHVQHHFDEENQWMHETQFPPRDCHIEQHDAVLASILEVRQLLNQGHHDICRDLAHALAEWFPQHATHLDSALAHWMFKRRYGGKPVVLRHRL